MFSVIICKIKIKHVIICSAALSCMTLAACVFNLLKNQNKQTSALMLSHGIKPKQYWRREESSVYLHSAPAPAAIDFCVERQRCLAHPGVKTGGS